VRTFSTSAKFLLNSALFPFRRSLVSKDSSSCRRDLLPLQSLTHLFVLLNCPTCPSGLTSQVLLPFNGIFVLAPSELNRSQFNSDPTSGFLNPSPVSASTSSTALFRAATVPGLSERERSPPRSRSDRSTSPVNVNAAETSLLLPHPFRGCMLPCGSLPPCKVRHLASLRLRFRLTPAPPGPYAFRSAN